MSDSLPELWDIDRVCAYRGHVDRPVAVNDELGPLADIRAANGVARYRRRAGVRE